ncbi:hydroxymethylbilane synthase [Candidatus Clostridium radicumherbarum]|uniref:Porphobilinogen deaminase n=1 Tax=Candidatus Clostridium radicumherbarum TaxID=3381662 RepID=A0ABW8TSJ9_9CLOT
MNLKIGSRKSSLAQIQTEEIIQMLKSRHGVEGEMYLLDTVGDRILNLSLDKIGDKGLFTKDIELALIDGRADAAVHSMKDVPFEINEVFEIAAMPVREDSRDVLVSREGLKFKELPKGAIIGTSSNRRISQLRLIRPDIQMVPIRGNIETRINKIESQGLDGIILAAAGLKRLNLEHKIAEYFDINKVVPAVGQGALGIEVLKESKTYSVFKSLDNKNVRLCVEAERSFMRELNGGCHSSLGAYAVIEGDTINIVGIFDIGTRLVKKDITGSLEDYLELGKALAKKILKG